MNCPAVRMACSATRSRQPHPHFRLGHSTARQQAGAVPPSWPQPGSWPEEGESPSRIDTVIDPREQAFDLATAELGLRMIEWRTVAKCLIRLTNKLICP